MLAKVLAYRGRLGRVNSNLDLLLRDESRLRAISSLSSLSPLLLFLLTLLYYRLALRCKLAVT